MPILNPRVTTVGRLFFEDSVPEQHRLNILKDQAIETNAVKSILQSVADTDPDNYNKISYSLLSLGSKAALQTESSLTLDDFRSPIDKGSVINKVEQQERSIFARKDLTSDQKNVEMMKTYGKLSYDMPALVFDSAMKNNNNLAKMVASGARGSKGQLNSNIGADWLVLDQNDNPIPIGIKHSYAEGLSPAEYFGSSYGTRSGLVSVKMATADSGFLSKQLAIAASNLIVTEKDCGTTRGIPVDADDKENIGTLLAKGSGGFGYNQILTAKDLKTFRDQKVGKIIVRSPMTCQAKSGLCAYCCGIREKGKLPSIMDNVGLGAGSAIGEPLSQGALGAKHKAGVAGSQPVARVSGFKALNAILQSPAVYPDGAPVSPEDGVVTKVENAPQGGYNVYVNQEKVYAPFSQTLLVKPGSKLEAGDPLTDGVVSSSSVVKYKGIGAGRLHLMNSLRKSFKDGGMPDNRRNIEVISRAVINHVSYTDSDNDEYLPDEIVPYSAIESSYVPSPDTKTLAPKDSLSKYLQKPSLYYSVGTRITPSVSKVLEENGEDKIEVSDTKPGFDSMYLRLMEQGSAKEDLADQLSSSYVTRSLKDSVLGGKSTSDIHGNSPQMALAYGLEFGNPPKGKVSY